MTALAIPYQSVDTSAHAGATNHLLVEGPQQMKKPLQSVIAVAPMQASPTSVQDIRLEAPQLQVLSPQAHLVAASYCSLAFHIPEGIVRLHTVHGQQQQILQHGHAQPPPYLHPKLRVIFAQAPQETVEEQQVVVVYPTVAATVGPITFAFPGYALLLRFVGRKGAIIFLK